MKKFGKFIFGTLSVASLAAGAYYVYKNFIKKETSDDFDEFEDDFEDFDFDDEEVDDETEEAREYLSINITSDEDPAEDSVTDTAFSDDEV